MNAFEEEVYQLLVTFPDSPVTQMIERESQGTPHLVEFDHRVVYKYLDDPGAKVEGFFHVHPPGCPDMSVTDFATMRGWAKCVPKETRLLCLIQSDNRITAYVFWRDKVGGINIKCLTFNRPICPSRWGTQIPEDYVVEVGNYMITWPAPQLAWPAPRLA